MKTAFDQWVWEQFEAEQGAWLDSIFGPEDDPDFGAPPPDPSEYEEEPW